MTHCREDLVLVNGEICLEKNQMHTLVFQFYLSTLELLATLNGKNICHNTNDRMYYKIVLKHLTQVFGKHKDFDTTLDTFNRTWKDYFVYDLDMDNGDFEIKSNRVELTDLCRVKIFAVENMIVVIGFVLLLVLLVYLLLLELKKQRFISLAEKLYRCIYLEIKNKESVSVLFFYIFLDNFFWKIFLHFRFYFYSLNNLKISDFHSCKNIL